MVTLGVSSERGAVHAVALAAADKLPERVLVHHRARTRGDSKAEVAAAVEAAMDELALAVGPDREIGGAAVAYRDAAERRAIVTRLAAGRWHTASLVSEKSAHLHVAGGLTWLDEFDHLLICEAVPGYQAFTLIDRGRRRVLAAIAQAGGTTAEALGVAVSAAWDQFEAAAVRPDAVVLIGSAANRPDVVAAVNDFGAPVLPCAIAAAAPAVGAALAAVADEDELSVVVTQTQRGRGGTALLAAASVLAAGGLIAGGVYMASSAARSTTGAVVADAGIGSGSSSAAVGGVRGPFGEGRRLTDGQRAPKPIDITDSHSPDGTVRWWGSSQDAPLPLVPSEPPGESEIHTDLAQAVPGTGIPGDTTTKIGAPNAALLFPGESPPPVAFTPESYRWWDNHFRLLSQWAAQQPLHTSARG